MGGACVCVMGDIRTVRKVFIVEVIIVFGDCVGFFDGGEEILGRENSMWLELVGTSSMGEFGRVYFLF